MKEQNFLYKLGKLKLVNSSEEIKSSYLEKAENSLKSAKILSQNNLYEDSVSMSYYAMYHSLTALLFKIGIKCENHSGSIILLKTLLNREDLSKTISKAKKERIDKQYYVLDNENFQVNKESTDELINLAEDFILEIKLELEMINQEKINSYRKKFSEITEKPKYEKNSEKFQEF